MSIELPFRDIYQKQNSTFLLPAFARGIVSAIHIESGTVDVSLAASPQTIIKNVPVNCNIALEQVVVGDRCKIDFFDEKNPEDSVVAYTYGRVLYKKVNHGTATLTVASPKIEHGLGVIPDIVIVPPNNNLQAPTGTSGGPLTNFYQYASVDSRYINFTTIGSPGSQAGYIWFAAVLK